MPKGTPVEGLTSDEVLSILCQAAAEPIGLLIRAHPVNLVRTKFHNELKSSGLHIGIRISPFPEGDIILLNLTNLPSISTHRKPKSLLPPSSFEEIFTGAKPE